MGDSPWLIRELEDESFPSATTQNFAQLRWVAQEPEQTPRIRFPILRQLVSPLQPSAQNRSKWPVFPRFEGAGTFSVPRQPRTFAPFKGPFLC